MQDLGAILFELGGNVEGVGRQLKRRRRDFNLNELESLRQTLLSNAGTLEAVIRIQKHEIIEEAERIAG